VSGSFGRRILDEPPRVTKSLDLWAEAFQQWIDKLRDALDNGLPAGAGTIIPENIEAGSIGAVGDPTDGWSPASHEHPVETGIPAALALISAEGVSTAIPRLDHQHGTPLTTKGDILVTDGSSLQRLAAGANGFAVVANAMAALGLDYEQFPDLFLDLAASWRFEEAAIGPFYDSWGQNNLTAYGALTSITGKVGKAIQIGAGGAMQCPYASAFALGGLAPFGFATLVFPNGTNPGWQEFPFGNENFAGPNVFDYYLTFNNSGLMVPEFRMSGPIGTNSLIWPASLSAAWHLIMCWFDGANMWMQVDGATPVTQAAGTGGTNGLTTPITLGALYEGGTTFVNQFAGSIDSTQFWNGNVLANANFRSMLWNGGLGREIYIPLPGSVVAALPAGGSSTLARTFNFMGA